MTKKKDGFIIPLQLNRPAEPSSIEEVKEVRLEAMHVPNANMQINLRKNYREIDGVPDEGDLSAFEETYAQLQLEIVPKGFRKPRF